jgi:hypothetical protein
METCQKYDKLCVKNIILTLVHLLVLLYKIHINAQTWITLRKDNILLFQNSLWAYSSFSQLLDGPYSYVLQFPGHMYMGHYSNTWKSALYIAHIAELVPKCGTNLPNQTVSIRSYSSHVTSISQPKLSTSCIQPSHRGWFSRGHTPHHSDGTYAFNPKYCKPIVH